MGETLRGGVGIGTERDVKRGSEGGWVVEGKKEGGGEMGCCGGKRCVCLWGGGGGVIIGREETVDAWALVN